MESCVCRTGHEIKQYLQNTAQNTKYYRMSVFKMKPFAATWSDAKQCWIIKTNQGELHSQFAIMACGPMHEPVIPNIQGLKDFKGDFPFIALAT